MKLFYEHASMVFGLAGMAMATILYEIYVHPQLQGLLFPLTMVVMVMGGVFIGRTIHTLHYGAFTDALTTLWNRRYFYVRLREEMGWMQRKGTPLCIALIDIDNFKTINDQYGHATGDAVLIHIANIFKQYTRNTDSVIRWGGDEFAILFSETSLDCARNIAERIRQAVAIDHQCFEATISVGIIFVEKNWDEQQILTAVDEMLFEAKKAKNLVVSFITN